MSPSPSVTTPADREHEHEHGHDAPAGPGPSTPSPDESAKKRRKVTRSRLGCLTCRKRRKLCDMAKPCCDACSRLKMVRRTRKMRMWLVFGLMGLRTAHGRPIAPAKRLGRHRYSAQRKLSSAAPPHSSNASDNVPAFSFPSPLSNFSTSLTTRPGPGQAELPINVAGISTANVPKYTNAPAHLHGAGNYNNNVNGTGNRNTDGTGNGDGNGNGTMADLIGIWGDVNNSATNATVKQPEISPIQTFDDLPITSITPPGAGAGDFSGMFADGFNFDEATLQLWAADCLTVPSAQSVDPFESLNNLLRPYMTQGPVIPLAATSSASVNHPPSRPSSQPGSDSPNSHAPLLDHYQQSLSALVSCGDTDSPNSFDAFTRLANSTASSSAGKGLHLSILAWAGKHMVNQGQAKYEAVSERLGSQATQIIMTKLDEYKNGGSAQATETERMTLLAGALMIVQFKICRGDVWGFDVFVDHLKQISAALYTPDSPGAAPDSMPFSFFENLLYHEVLSTFVFTRGPILPYTVVSAFSRPASDNLHTLTGVSLPLFCKMYRIAALVRQRRSKRGGKKASASASASASVSATGAWSDDGLVDMVRSAEELEAELAEEKKRMDALVISKPNIASHRYLHEAYRTACLLSLRTFVLLQPPSSLNIRLLVRQSLSLLEAMCDQNLPGYCSSHWVLFCTAVCAVPGQQEEGEMDDRERVDRLYEDTINDLGFLNTSRSQKIVHEVWARNQEGRLCVDWLDVVAEYDWELFLV